MNSTKTMETVNKKEVQRILVRLKDLCDELEILLSSDESGEFALSEKSETIFGRILGEKSEAKNNESFDMELEITDIIKSIGVPAHIRGYKYLRYAIALAVEDDEMVAHITKMLYPSVAKEFDTAPSRVERAMRHAIEKAFDYGDKNALTSIFGDNVFSRRMTNAEFIAHIADEIRLQKKRAA